MKQSMIKTALLYTLLLAPLGACSTAQLQQASTAISAGQLVCQVGPTALAMVYPQAQPFPAKDTSEAIVKEVCAAVNGVAVNPPASGQANATATVSLQVPVTD